ncbi:MAG: N-(5'-phosphoribosyl)anthranilate isomerase, partial [Pseudomonadota bacterium]
MSDIAVKICGLRKPEHVKAAVDAGARYVGFVFYPKSPRAVTLDAARELA